MQVRVETNGTVKPVIPDSDTIVLPYRFKHPIPSGSIPDRVKRVDMQSVLTDELELGAIPNSVTHLFLRVLTKDMVIPGSVTDLFIRDFNRSMIKLVPASIVNLFIHMGNREHAPTDRAHYLFYFTGRTIEVSSCDAKRYT